MVTYSEIIQGEHLVNDVIRQAEMARAYQTVTAQHGPSQALIDFINNDGGLKEEIGLEAFDTFSTEVQHEIFSSKINVDQLESIALESLAGNIQKMAKWLTGAGSVVALGGFFTGSGNGMGEKGPTGSLIAFVGGLVAMATGGIVMAVNKKINGVVVAKDFKEFQAAFDGFAREKLLTINHIPDPKDQQAWEAFAKARLKSGVLGAGSKILGKVLGGHMPVVTSNQEDAEDASAVAQKKVNEEAGWDVASFTASAKWLKVNVEKFDELEKTFAKKLEALEKWAASAEAGKDSNAKIKLSVISAAIHEEFKSFEEGKRLLVWATKSLQKVSKLFEEKK